MGSPSYKFASKDCSAECVRGHPGLKMAVDLLMTTDMDYKSAFEATKVKLAANQSLLSAHVTEAGAGIVATAAGHDKGTGGRSA